MCDNDLLAEGGTFVSQRHTDVPVHVNGPGSRATNLLAEACTVRQVLDHVGGKWSVSILLAAIAGPVRFSELERLVEGISRRMLTLTLRNLERDGLLCRKVYATVPPGRVHRHRHGSRIARLAHRSHRVGRAPPRRHRRGPQLLRRQAGRPGGLIIVGRGGLRRRVIGSSAWHDAAWR